jgi:hypothetical protein
MSFFRKAQTPGFLQAVSDLEQGVRDRDSAISERAFTAISSGFQKSSTADAITAGPRLAALLPDFPPTGPRGVLAVVVGACIERGADAVACAGPILEAVDEAVRDALAFALAWGPAGGGDLPDPEQTALDDAVIGRVSSQIGDPRAAHRAALAWWTLGQWEMASVAVLSHGDARRAVASELRQRLLGHVEQLREATKSAYKCLYYALLVLDDADIVVLDRPTGTGYRVRVSGLGDNFQLHTLLAHALVGGGHLPGQAPTPQAVAVALDQQVPEGRRLDTTGAFNLVSPHGEWIWNEGTPSDIPVVDGVRLLVLDPPPYQRGWSAGRFFPGMTASLTLTEVLSGDEASRWFEHVKPASGPAR